jgi:hypothetical protein
MFAKKYTRPTLITLYILTIQKSNIPIAKNVSPHTMGTVGSGRCGATASATAMVGITAAKAQAATNRAVGWVADLDIDHDPSFVPWPETRRHLRTAR